MSFTRENICFAMFGEQVGQNKTLKNVTLAETSTRTDFVPLTGGSCIVNVENLPEKAATTIFDMSFNAKLSTVVAVIGLLLTLLHLHRAVLSR